MLSRLTYVSTATEGVDLNEFKSILLQAQNNNQRLDLTGMLVFNSTVFLQTLEGDRDQVNALYSKIIRDPRHTRINLIEFKEIKTREWANWSMGFAAPNSKNRALFLKYSTQSVFNPYVMTAENTEKMLFELVSSAISMEAQPPKAQATAEAAPEPQAESQGLFSRFIKK